MEKNTVIVTESGQALNSSDGWEYGIILCRSQGCGRSLRDVELYASRGAIDEIKEIYPISKYPDIDQASNALKYLWNSIRDSVPIWNVKDVSNQVTDNNSEK